MTGGQRGVVAGAIALLALVLGAAGCGGGSEEPAPTKNQYLARTEVICGRLIEKQNEGMQAFGEAHGFSATEPSRQEREATNAAVVLPIVEEKLKKLRSLSVPEGDEGRIERIFDAMEHAIQVTEEHPNWLAEPKSGRPEPFEPSSDMAAAYGYVNCIRP